MRPERLGGRGLLPCAIDDQRPRGVTFQIRGLGTSPAQLSPRGCYAPAIDPISISTTHATLVCASSSGDHASDGFPDLMRLGVPALVLGVAGRGAWHGRATGRLAGLRRPVAPIVMARGGDCARRGVPSAAPTRVRWGVASAAPARARWAVSSAAPARAGDCGRRGAASTALARRTRSGDTHDRIGVTLRTRAGVTFGRCRRPIGGGGVGVAAPRGEDRRASERRTAQAVGFS
mmetsp:Transcript_47865/g.108535  ORF Transcript_47865/g.108535 Transcript_47865/m.108535 type:complete len:233 (-) Transcript_47865:483-1181(-)